MDFVPNRLPAILCLHGGGTSAAIFNVQTHRLQRALRTKFQFVFVDAPFQSLPGPGVLPVFEGCGPFYTWVKEGEGKSDGEREAHETLRLVMDAQARTPAGPFCGVMGFSQGARMAAGLMLRQQQQQQQEEAVFDDKSSRLELQFGLFLNGTSPPILPQVATTAPALMRPKIRLPTVHIHGRFDPWRGDSKILLAENFDETAAKVLDAEVGHHLPVSMDETLRIAAMVSRAFSDRLGR